jgi:hypothetical protein
MFDTLNEIKLAMQIYLKVGAIKNWKSTLMACIVAVATYLSTVNWTDPAALKTAIIPILTVIWGVVQKDSDKTGNTVAN